MPLERGDVTIVGTNRVRRQVSSDPKPTDILRSCVSELHTETLRSALDALATSSPFGRPRVVDAAHAQAVTHGLSQQELGLKTGVHRNYVGGIERGERNPSVTAILKLTEAALQSLSGARFLGARHATRVAFERSSCGGRSKP